jgi:hypothetical protein
VQFIHAVTIEGKTSSLLLVGRFMGNPVSKNSAIGARKDMTEVNAMIACTCDAP